MNEARGVTLEVPGGGPVSGLFLRPVDATSLLVLGHGAGAGMRHPFMQSLARALAGRGVATLRYHFPYMESGRRAPDRPPKLVATVRAACAFAGDVGNDLPLLAGGKSMGGRMTSTAAAEEALPGVRGLVFFGFPLHGIGKPPSVDRGLHLAHVGLPMLFLQGTRDKLADLEFLRPLLADIDPSPVLHVVNDADHGFHVLKRTGRTGDEVIEELASVTADFSRSL